MLFCVFYFNACIYISATVGRRFLETFVSQQDKALEREYVAYGLMMNRIFLVQYFNLLSNIKLFNILA